MSETDEYWNGENVGFHNGYELGLQDGMRFLFMYLKDTQGLEKAKVLFRKYMVKFGAGENTINDILAHVEEIQGDVKQ